MTKPELTDRDKKLLDIFALTWSKPGPKATAIREATGLTPTAATQIVNALIETEAALEYAPIAVRRLLRIRDAGLARSRTSHRRAGS